eukprot:TRINITY_DN3738_c0_g4_i1.p1 TRINITY_DN3738_c0_g4~~TRINITY_DN3738_c0_g4_i1.p1  ORF type:complete len:651 (-),score=176.22 TRINITY_DN3738_c0_g4_i1:131-2083(-)
MSQLYPSGLWYGSSWWTSGNHDNKPISKSRNHIYCTLKIDSSSISGTGVQILDSGKTVYYLVFNGKISNNKITSLTREIKTSKGTLVNKVHSTSFISSSTSTTTTTMIKAKTATKGTDWVGEMELNHISNLSGNWEGLSLWENKVPSFFGIFITIDENGNLKGNGYEGKIPLSVNGKIRREHIKMEILIAPSQISKSPVGSRSAASSMTSFSTTSLSSSSAKTSSTRPLTYLFDGVYVDGNISGYITRDDDDIDIKGTLNINKVIALTPTISSSGHLASDELDEEDEYNLLDDTTTDISSPSSSSSSSSSFISSVNTSPKLTQYIITRRKVTVPSCKMDKDIWIWDDNGVWKNFPEPQNSVVAKAASEGYNQTSINILGQNYLIDFNSMTQINLQTNFKRSVSTRVIEYNNYLKKFTTNNTTSSTISTTTTNTTTTTTPTRWLPSTINISGQQSNLEIIKLKPTDDDYMNVSKIFLSTLSGKRIISIERIHNVRVRQYYEFEYRQILDKYEYETKEYVKLLFHGTSNTKPEMIYNGERGFLTQFASEGLWGKGTYFAEKAVYSDSYAHRKDGGNTKQMFLAEVIVGESYHSAQDKNIRMPPINNNNKKSSNNQFSALYYDSVSGDAYGTPIYVVYDNHKAYPTFLITYDP